MAVFAIQYLIVERTQQWQCEEQQVIVFLMYSLNSFFEVKQFYLVALHWKPLDYCSIHENINLDL